MSDKDKDRQQKTQQNKFWLQTQVNDILEPMVLACCQAKADNKIKFMLKYMEDNYGERATIGDKGHLQFLRNECKRLQGLVDVQKANTAGTTDDEKKSDRGSENETDEDDEDDYVDILPEQIAKRQAKGPRGSVSAEAFGAFNKKSDFKARVVPKSDAAKTAIKEKIEKSFMFSALTEQEKNVIIDAMDQKKAMKGECIIKEGDQGDCLYVLAEGTASCTKVFAGNTDPTFLKRYQPGEAFGELALLYNAPRAATISSDDESLLYVLDRQTFNHIVKDASMRRKEKYEAFLKTVPLLETMDDYERVSLSEAFIEANFKSNDLIIKQGEPGKEMYFLVEGEAFAQIDVNGEKKEVKQYKTGDYFGELALLKGEPRAASIVAKTECQVVSVDRHSFKRMLGPLDHILKRNLDLYTKFNA